MNARASRIQFVTLLRRAHARAALRVLVLPLVLGLAAPAIAHVRVADLKGSIGVGYTKLFTDVSPAGSLSAAVGLRVPVKGAFSVGPAVTFHLLGSRTVERGSLLANLDYSAFEAGLLAHWAPRGWGPLALISAGPEVFTARADLSTTGGGAAFSDLAVHTTVGGIATNVTLMQSREAPVRVGLELGGRWAFVSGNDWKLLSGRLVFHY